MGLEKKITGMSEHLSFRSGTLKIQYISLINISHLMRRCVRAVRLEQWSSIWGTRTPGGMRRHPRGYAKTSYINQNETQEPLEP
jgi:hypothetical protein